ncbi:MAG TPA: hypothetical protein VK809_12225 [Bacteroidia bacterium]|jgi:hypothetical protein|nr:hypothetical protein [Bacteroidia bacterium]
MKKSILTTICIVLCVMGLMAQSRKADTAKKPKSEETYTLTHQDSVLIQKLMIDAQLHPVDNNMPPVKGAHPFTDVIDVEHEIK